MLKRLTKWMSESSDKRSQHLVFLVHIWVFTPFLVLWLRSPQVRALLGPTSLAELQPIIGVTIVYLAIRTVIALRSPSQLRWDYIFPPLDVAVVTMILCASHRGPMSNITLLYFLPMIEGAGSLSVVWSASVGLMVVVGTALAATTGMGVTHDMGANSLKELWQEDGLNIAFRVCFYIVVSSLMTYQALIAAGMQKRLAVAADRNRIAADMHDGVQGHLITIASQLELLSRVADRDPTRARELAGEAREVARQGADELRFLVQRMRAPSLEEGFVTALRQYTRNFCSRNDLDLDFQMVGENPDLSPEAEGALFRVAQEALTNIVKHANSATVQITLTVAEKTVLEIRDRGLGFSDASSGSGLAGMEDRMKSVNGALVVETSLGQGTHLVATV